MITELTQIFSLNTIIVQLITGGMPIAKRLFFLPNLSAMIMVIAGATAWPSPTMAVRVDASEGDNGRGNLGSVSIPRVGEFHPAIHPLQNMRAAPGGRIGRDYQLFFLRRGSSSDCTHSSRRRCTPRRRSHPDSSSFLFPNPASSWIVARCFLQKYYAIYTELSFYSDWSNRQDSRDKTGVCV